MRGRMTTHKLSKSLSLLVAAASISTGFAGCGDAPNIDPVQQPISAEIFSPLNGADFYEGQPIRVSGRVSDPNPGGASTITEVTVTAVIGSTTVQGHPEDDGTITLEVPTSALVGGNSYSLSLTGSRPKTTSTKPAAAAVDILPNLPPGVEMLEPSQDKHLYAGMAESLRFEIEDAETRYETWSVKLLIDGVEAPEADLSLEAEGSDFVAQLHTQQTFEEGQTEVRLEVTDGFGKKVEIRRPLDVGPANRLPTCAIVAPVDGAILYTDEPITLQATTQDADQAPQTLRYAWTVGQDLAGQGYATSSGSISTVLAGGLSTGPTQVMLTITDELGAVCEARQNITILAPNAGPEVNIVYPATDLGDGALLTEEDTLYVSVQITDREDTIAPAAWLSINSESAALPGATCNLSGSGVNSQGLHAFDYDCSAPASALPLDQKVTVYARGRDGEGVEASDRVVVQVRPCIDADHDGYSSCKEPGCDDNAQVNPGVTEVCDGTDNNCDTLVDNGALDAILYYRDYDGDKFGTDTQSVKACAAPSGYVAQGGDCNDRDTKVHPDAIEVCGDRIDNNCDGQIDEAIDADKDGFISCDSDCDDTDPTRFPGNAEVCDGKDNNCDLVIPDGERDNDHDGYPACAESCDADASANPGMPELCNGKDDNCDGIIPADEQDNDKDGAINCLEPACADDPSKQPSSVELCDGLDNNCDGWVDEGLDKDHDGFAPCAVNGMPGDCNDANASIYPGAPEQCDGIDSNCDTIIDTDPTFDQDRDGMASCLGDCDDLDASVGANAKDVLDGKDNDCNGELDDTLIEESSSGSYLGDAARQLAGQSLAGVGDINNDGQLDYVVGVPRYSIVSTTGGKDITGIGRAYIFLGNGLAPSRYTDLKTASVYITGENQEDELGGTVVGLGDINGDKIADFAVGARFNRDIDGPTLPALAGATYIVYGCDSTKDSTCFKPVYSQKTGVISRTVRVDSKGNPSDPDPSNDEDNFITSASCSIESGAAVQTRSDAKELITGICSGNDWKARYVKVEGSASAEYLGSALGSVGDVDGDGLQDVLMGAPGHSPAERPLAGAAYLLLGQSAVYGVPDFGANSRVAVDPRPFILGVSQVSARFEGANQNDSLGAALADHAGDVNGDGYADVLVGAPSTQAEGRAYLFLGGPHLAPSGKLAVIEGSQADAVYTGEAEALVGASVALADLNGDAFDDVIVGAPDSETYDGSLFSFSAGRVYVIYGQSEELIEAELDLNMADLIIEGELQPEQIGSSLSGGEDFNGDGFQDLLIGAPGWSTPEWTQLSFRGRAYLLLGRDDLPMDTFLQSGDMDASFAGGTPGSTLSGDPMNSARVGSKVSMVGELYKSANDSTAFADLLISSPYFDTSVADAGKVYVILGRDLR